MTDLLDSVRDHYRATDLTERLKSTLTELGLGNGTVTPRQLAAFDQFHIRGLTATLELGKLAELRAGQSVLDVGCGLGGPARILAENHGCRVIGLDLSETFIEAARFLTERTGQSGQIAFHAGNALAMPFAAGGFDVALLQHVAMNIAEREALYGEVRRVLKPGGRLVAFDVVAKEGEPLFPVPWARTAATSFLLTADQTRAAILAAGFRPLVWQDDSEAAKAWIVHVRESSPPPMPNLSLVMGPDFFRFVDCLGRNLLEGRLGVISAVFEAVP